MFETIFSCHYGCDIEEHESEKNSENKGSSTKCSSEYTKTEPTNAYGTIAFYGAGKRTRAKVEFMLFLYNVT